MLRLLNQLQSTHTRPNHPVTIKEEPPLLGCWAQYGSRWPIAERYSRLHTRTVGDDHKASQTLTHAPIPSRRPIIHSSNTAPVIPLSNPGLRPSCYCVITKLIPSRCNVQLVGPHFLLLYFSLVFQGHTKCFIFHVGLMFGCASILQ